MFDPGAPVRKPRRRHRRDFLLRVLLTVALLGATILFWSQDQRKADAIDAICGAFQEREDLRFLLGPEASVDDILMGVRKSHAQRDPNSPNNALRNRIDSLERRVVQTCDSYDAR